MFDTAYLNQLTDRLQTWTVPRNSAAGQIGIWQKPRGCLGLYLMVIGPGGNGGNGAAGAASAAAGGGGGGSGGCSFLIASPFFLPDTLFLYYGPAAALYVTVTADVPVGHTTVLYANIGGNGGNASGATGGAAGAAGFNATIASQRQVGAGRELTYVGQAGIVGGTTGAGGAVTVPTTALLVTGGASGAGVGVAGSTGSAGGAVTASGVWLGTAGGVAAGSTTGSGGNGANGGQATAGLGRYSGGGGGGSSGGAGGNGGNGGAGGIGCGGGGGGGCFTGGTPGVGGVGGHGRISIMWW